MALFISFSFSCGRRCSRNWPNASAGSRWWCYSSACVGYSVALLLCEYWNDDVFFFWRIVHKHKSTHAHTPCIQSLWYSQHLHTLSSALEKCIFTAPTSATAMTATTMMVIGANWSRTFIHTRNRVQEEDEPIENNKVEVFRFFSQVSWLSLVLLSCSTTPLSFPRPGLRQYIQELFF